MPHPAFVDSLERALIYEVLAFLAVAVLVVFLRKPAAGQPGYDQAPNKEAPVPVEI